MPTALVPVIGKRFIKQSLKTPELKKAKALRNALNVKVDAEFAAAENALEAPEEADKPISIGALTEYLRHHIETLDRRSAESLMADPLESEEQRAEMVMNTEIGLQVRRKAVNGSVSR